MLCVSCMLFSFLQIIGGHFDSGFLSLPTVNVYILVLLVLWDRVPRMGWQGWRNSSYIIDHIGNCWVFLKSKASVQGIFLLRYIVLHSPTCGQNVSNLIRLQVPATCGREQAAGRWMRSGPGSAALGQIPGRVRGPRARCRSADPSFLEMGQELVLPAASDRGLFTEISQLTVGELSHLLHINEQSHAEIKVRFHFPL